MILRVQRDDITLKKVGAFTDAFYVEEQNVKISCVNHRLY